MSKRFFQILDEMNLKDVEDGTSLVGVNYSLVAADYSKKHSGTIIQIGVPGNVVFDIESGKTVPVLLMVDKREYDKLDKIKEK